jgi:regulator of sirC expression with transglutaminase-like and TPR domain
MKFDRIFNKVEKFDARAMTDPYNHERREKRMLEKKEKDRLKTIHTSLEISLKKNSSIETILRQMLNLIKKTIISKKRWMSFILLK